MSKRRGRIPAAFLKHPPPSWRKHRRNPILGDSANTIMGMNPKRRVYLSSHWHHFVKRKPRARKNPHYRRNPGGTSTMTWVLIGGAAFLFLTPSGRALASRFTGGNITGLPPGVPAGSVRLPDGTYRTPTGQIIGTPVSGAPGWMAPIASLVPGITSAIGSWIRGLSDTSSTTTPGSIITSEPPASGVDLTGTHDILTGGYNIGDPLPPLPPLPDLTLQSPGGTDFWSGIDTSGWWGNIGAPLDPLAGPVPVLDLSLSPGDASLLDAPLTDPWSSLMGFGQVQTVGPVGRHRFRQPPSFR